MKKQKTTSLIRQINARMQWPRFFAALWADIAAALAAAAAWCLALEAQYGALDLLQLRQFGFAEAEGFFKALQTCFYTFTPAHSVAVCTVNVGPVLTVLAAVLPVLWVLQLICWGTGWARNARFLRRVLRPINEAALEAQRIAESSINEQQLHNMERAINSVTYSDASVHIGDADLRGVETAINRLLLRLKDSYEEQTRFVDDASHELRTPIAVIHGYSSILDRWGKDDPETLDESVKAILEESEHMQTLVDQLLFLARGDGGRQHLDMQPTDASGLLREIAEESRMIDSEHEYLLQEGSTAPVLADAAMLKQAVRILTDNAAKYTPQKGRITLRSETFANGSVGLTVQDSGVGMSQKDASHIFDRFFRGDAVRGSTKGSGLGLSIAKWIADRHGGRIEVLSYPDIGTRMTLILPAYDPGGSLPAAVSREHS